jgi:hypothetical protein
MLPNSCGQSMYGQIQMLQLAAGRQGGVLCSGSTLRGVGLQKCLFITYIC